MSKRKREEKEDDDAETDAETDEETGTSRERERIENFAEELRSKMKTTLRLLSKKTWEEIKSDLMENDIAVLGEEGATKVKNALRRLANRKQCLRRIMDHGVNEKKYLKDWKNGAPSRCRHKNKLISHLKTCLVCRIGGLGHYGRSSCFFFFFDHHTIFLSLP